MRAPSHLINAANDIRLAFFDIDGTLLDSHGQLRPELFSAIKLLKARGIKTAIASGRPYFAARFLMDELGIQDASMFYTGAHIYDPQSRKTLLDTPLKGEDAQAVFAAANAMGLYAEAYTDSAFYTEQSTEISKVHAQHLRVNPILNGLADVINRFDIAKLLLGVNRTKQGDLLSTLEAQFPDLIFARAYLTAYPDWQFASVISAAATKQRAFDYLLRYHNVQAHQVISFGDAESDMDFLRMAGIGVAMGNANPNVQSVADWVTQTADNAGVAYAINQLFNPQP
ncbi:MAG TPA: HAD family hydrolase [Cellvibrio sp.]